MAGTSTDPLWFKDAIIYELHVKCFSDSNADGFGDFQGLIQKLDYVKELGVDTIWLLPFYPSPLRDDGYDIADYESVNPVYGKESDFRQLLDEAHARGLRVITELVVNHTSDQHPWFQSARQAPPGSAQRDYYVWSDTDQKYKDARIIFTDTESSNWTWDPVAKAFYWHRFFSHQPDLNFANPKVLEAVTDVMLKWFEMGVDGMRLDAVPYLMEREGTNCENLPETHEIIKHMRRVLDKNFEDRIFLGEACQQPCDVCAYFGNGDECHMAYNFPIMPRLYLALHQEDHRPITDTMEQLPNIPDKCQWAIFLRNHDELTLEMVTDSERAYLYHAYAYNPRMRVNTGIRRRLAPLMEYSLAKIQLMNSLLFSLPGTPIVYYGDEIGMGDNIYLNDRDGVRTPMQWNGGPNGGFSAAPAEKLYLPAITDPITGYQAVNVEQQQLNPSSLLNWMKQIIKLRKQHKVFGRGTIEFIDTSNQSVLSFMRKWEDETVLVVANLSRYPQAVELPLSVYEGTSPVEMFGLNPFPQIRTAPYPLTLGAHQFYWFRLAKEHEAKPLDAGAAKQAVPYIDVSATDAYKQLTSGPLKSKLETTVLPGYISRQRWYGGKASKIISTRILDWADLHIPSEKCGLFIIEVEADNGSKELYSLCLAVAHGARAEQLLEQQPRSVIAELRSGSQRLAIYDAVQCDDFCRKLLQALRGNNQLTMQQGILETEATPFFEKLTAGEDTAVRRVPSEQSNTSIIFGSKCIFKLYRKLQIGNNPDYEIPRFLTEEGNFAHVPAVGGAFVYRKEKTNQCYTLGLLHQFFPNQGDCWKHYVSELMRFYDRAETRVSRLHQFSPQSQSLAQLLEREIPAEVQNMLGLYLDDTYRLGERTGQMHRLLSSGRSGSAFTAEIINEAELKRFAEETLKRLDRVFAHLSAHKSQASLQQGELIDTLTSLREELAAGVVKIKTCKGLKKIRVHGDLHLGQVLNTGTDYVLLDFEGEPGRSLEERVQKQSPLKDVAGMVRSFNYAAWGSLLQSAEKCPDKIDQLLPWALACSTWSAVAFLKGYRRAVAGGDLVPADAQKFTEALEPFVVDKAIYEIDYELNNRPLWLTIPLAGLVEYISTATKGRTAGVH
jgi:maltose alpha-D-glucosyltransferase/alpha-amylase